MLLHGCLHLRQRIHCRSTGAGISELYQQHGCAILIVEKLLYVLRKHLFWNGHVHQVTGPNDLIHPFYAFQRFL